MDKITPFDINRMLFGDAPPEFLLEVFFRGLALYLFMLLVVRLLGKRMAGELTVMEMVLMITLGGSIAVAMQVPEGGLLLGFVVLTCAFSYERTIAWLTVKSKKFEKISQGQGIILVKDGVLQIQNMKDTNITGQQIFANLRAKKIHQLGKVQRLYLEASGTLSIYKSEEKRPGLSIFPENDEQIIKLQKQVDGTMACNNCGFIISDFNNQSCAECGHSHWVQAIL